jgi:hypothetical protein
MAKVVKMAKAVKDEDKVAIILASPVVVAGLLIMAAARDLVR